AEAPVTVVVDGDVPDADVAVTALRAGDHGEIGHAEGCDAQIGLVRSAISDLKNAQAERRVLYLDRRRLKRIDDGIGDIDLAELAQLAEDETMVVPPLAGPVQKADMRRIVIAFVRLKIIAILEQLARVNMRFGIG